jgi:uncharacterized Ntn-hydrolase superfamily protein
MTFSIAARCPRTGQLGIAISTAVPAVGALAVFVRAGAGAVASQAWVNPYLGVDGLDLLAEGRTAHETLDTLIAADPGASSRQLGIVDAAGRVAAFTGSGCPDWCGHIEGDGFTVQGNILVAGTIEAMAESAAATAALPLDERLMRALEAGQAAGGDKRGRQSAALKVVGTEAYGLVDLRVDDHADPIAELRRILELSRAQLAPLVAALATRDNPAGGAVADSLVAMLVKPPAERPQRP